ncbi:MAG: hypothetical protein KF716_27310 [Anaerolineae bacterium]|nr:hypothetical protein [Anaerolineae bacterium]
MATLTRDESEALYRLFNRFALEDQRNYYRTIIAKSRTAARQVNQLRAVFALLTGLSSALAGLIVATDAGAGNPATATIVVTLLVIAIVTPIIGSAFGTLGDLYQWDRLTTVYEGALQNIEVADALSPDSEDDDKNYTAALRAFAEGTLSVMRDESAQWGQLIRPPRQIEEFLQAEARKAMATGADFGLSSADSGTTPPTPPKTPPAGGVG